MKTDTTAERVMAMDERELQRAVAERLGITDIRFVDGQLLGQIPGGPYGPIVCWSEYIEDAWDLEEQLEGEQLRWYGHELCCLVGYTGFGIAHASPADRCRAWLLTMRETER